MTQPVIMVKTTLMDGPVLRWYRNIDAATIHRGVLSASRNGVLVENGEYLTNVPPEWVHAARTVHAVLSADPRADVSHMATHRNGHGLSNGPIEKIEKEG